MGKLDELKRAGGAHALESMGAPSRGRVPAGMDGIAAVGKPAHLEGTAREKGALRISVDRIVPDADQPRTEFDEEDLGRLAESLKARGQLQPVRVRWDQGRGVYVLVMGERRWRAAKLAGLTELSCIVHEGEIDAGERLALQLVENALRADLTPIEQARAYRRLMDAQDWSARQLADELQLAPSTVTRALALLELPETVQDHVDRGDLPARAAYELAKLDDASAQAEVAQAAVDQKLSRSEVADVVAAVRAKRPAPALKPEPVMLDLGEGCTVTIRWKKAGGPDEIQALRKALKLAQTRKAQEGQGEAA